MALLLLKLDQTQQLHPLQHPSMKKKVDFTLLLFLLCMPFVLVAFLLVEDAQIDPNAHLQPPRKRQKIGEQYIAHWAGIDDEAAVMPRDEEKKESLESEINRYLSIAPLSWYSSSLNIISVFSSFSYLFFLL